jgi:predicted RNA-binding protein Jag
VIERFSIFGGVARYLLVKRDKTLQDLEQELGARDAAEWSQVGLLGLRTKYRHRLVHTYVCRVVPLSSFSEGLRSFQHAAGYRHLASL